MSGKPLCIEHDARPRRGAECRLVTATRAGRGLAGNAPHGGDVPNRLCCVLLGQHALPVALLEVALVRLAASACCEPAEQLHPFHIICRCSGRKDHRATYADGSSPRRRRSCPRARRTLDASAERVPAKAPALARSLAGLADTVPSPPNRSRARFGTRSARPSRRWIASAQRPARRRTRSCGNRSRRPRRAPRQRADRGRAASRRCPG